MRKSINLFLIMIFFIGSTLVFSNVAFAWRKNSKKAKEETVAKEVKKSEPGKIICKFKTKEDMAEFEKLYIAKQATLGRIGVLQTYFAMEQGNIQAIDKEMKKKFNFEMDQNKMYDLNRDLMEIKELGEMPNSNK